MREKKIIKLIGLLLGIVMLGGCVRPLVAEEAGMLFVNRLIYEDPDQRFEKNFVDGVALGKKLKSDRKELTENLVTSLNEFGNVLSEEQTEKMLTTWLTMVDEKTSYGIKEVMENKKEKTITVNLEVYGLDFQQIYKKTMDKLVARMLADVDLAKNNDKLGDLTIQLLSEEMEQAQPITESVIVPLKLKKEKKLWQLADEKNKEEISNILLAFLVGVDNIDTYSEVIGEAVTSAMDEALEKVEAELTGKKTTDSKKTKDATTKSSTEASTAESTKDPQVLETVETIETYADADEQ